MRFFLCGVAVMAILQLAPATDASAQAGNIRLRSQVIGSAGSLKKQAGSFMLSGIAAQVVAGRVSAGGIVVDQGFWARARILSAVPPTSGSENNSVALSVSPNPTRADVTITMISPIVGEATLLVYDAHGEVVRHLPGISVRQEPVEIVWDARDDNGRELPSGAYLLRLQVRGIRATSGASAHHIITIVR